MRVENSPCRFNSASISACVLFNAVLIEKSFSPNRFGKYDSLEILPIRSRLLTGSKCGLLCKLKEKGEGMNFGNRNRNSCACHYNYLVLFSSHRNGLPRNLTGRQGCIKPGGGEFLRLQTTEQQIRKRNNEAFPTGWLYPFSTVK